MNKANILTLLSVIALVLALPAVVLAQAQPPRPPVFGGTAMVDGVMAADGAKVAAMIDGVEAASTTVTGGGYAFSIPQPPGESFGGKTITFMVGDATAAETGVWEADGGAELDLNATMAMMAGAATVATGSAGLSQFLVDSKGMTLYLFTDDVQGVDGGDPVSNCSGGCANAWPPLTTDGDPVAMDQSATLARGSRVNPDMLGAMERTDDGVTANQVTYNGWPLYYYNRDKKAGDAAGQYGPWFVVSPTGNLVVGGVNEAPGGPPAGEQGGKGDRGDRGPQGIPGSAGDPGPKGDKGDTGSAGAAGARGATGAAGTGGAGPKGDAGAAGPAGAGPKGDPGVAGAPGQDGASGGGGALGIIALIIAIVAVAGAGAAIVMGRSS